MSDLKNLEDIFKDNLHDFHVSPTDKVWKGIKSNLWYSDIQNVFRNFSFQPTNSVWRAIAFRLWLKQFLTYSPATFNVYYLFSVVLIGFSSFYFYNQSYDFNQKTIFDETLKQGDVVSEINTYSSRRYNDFKADNSMSSENDNQENDVKTTQDIINNKPQNVVKKIDFNNEISDQNSNEALVIHKEPQLIENENNDDEEIRDYSSFPFINSLGLALKPDFAAQDFFYREIPVFKNRLLQWSLEGFILPMTEKASYKVDANEYPGFGVNYKAENPSNSFSYGILAEAKKKRISVQTGLIYSNFIDRPNYQTSNYQIDTSMVTQIIPGGYYNYYTVLILDLDTYLATGNSVYINVLDSTFIPENDTLIVQQISARKFSEYKRTSNSYTYIELPLIAGYTLPFGKINLTLRSGVIAGLLTFSDGNIPSPYSEQGTAEIIQNTQCNKFVLSGMAGIEIGYNVSSRISIVTSPVYRFNLNSVLKSDYIVDQRFKSFGVKFGVKYHL